MKDLDKSIKTPFAFNNPSQNQTVYEKRGNYRSDNHTVGCTYSLQYFRETRKYGNRPIVC